MPKYFMRGTRLGGLERMMMDSSRSAFDRPDPRKRKPQKKLPCDRPAAPHPPEQRRMSAPVIKCQKTPRKKCRFVAEVKEKR